MNSFSMASNVGTPIIRFSFTTLLSVAQPLRSTDLFSSNKPEVFWGCFAIGTPTFLLEMFALTSLCRVSPLTEATK